ncbi:MAG: acyl-CoA dehydrogenase family protein [bacterium]
MDLAMSAEDEAFRQEIRAGLDEIWPEEMRGGNVDVTRETYLPYHRALFDKGWVAPAWPKEYGGTGWSPTQRYIFDQEIARAEAVAPLAFNINMVGPVIYTFGNDAQKQRFLPPTLNGDIWWCQGYSEPGSGSDLASLRTRAVRQGDHYIVNGSKTWTTLAQHADWIFCLVRTNTEVKQQSGISFLLIDMKSPGITVRPIITLGGDHEVNEVFFEDVKVPVENLIGEEDKGWTYAKFLLVHERSGTAQVHQSKRALERLKQVANEPSLYGEAPTLGEKPEFIRKVADLEIDLMALEYCDLRGLAAEEAGKGVGAESSFLKIRGTELQQRISHLAVEVAGYYALPYQRKLGHNEKPSGPPHSVHAAAKYFNFRKTSIYGGTNEIQRNIIAKAILGL